MTEPIDYGDPQYLDLAEAMLARHMSGAAEANITSAVRDFLIGTGLVSADEIDEEVHPSDASRSAVDLTALDTYVESKRRTGYPIPESQWIEQLDGYLETSQADGRGVRIGVLTDGKHWFLRWPGAGPVRTEPPYSFFLESADHWLGLYEWLRDHALGAAEQIKPSRATVADRFGAHSVLYQRDLDALRRLYDEHAEDETIQVKRRLWFDLLRAAVGEVANLVDDPDDLFVRHTYLTAVTGMAVQARFGIDIGELAENDPADLLAGNHFRNLTALHGIVETDFFSWPGEVGGEALLAAIARRLDRFDWNEAPADIAAILYETVIPADERRQLGEYYTPDWLARAMIEELVDRPLTQRVLDPACGSGTFIAEAVTSYVQAAEGSDDSDALEKLHEVVVGIDVHPVAVHLARSAWVLAAQPLIERARQAGFTAQVSAPVYLGDSLQLRFDTGDLLAEAEVRIDVGDDDQNELIFPTSLVERADDFDAVLGGVADAIARGDDPAVELADHPLSASERRSLLPAVRLMTEFHDAGRDHIWAYYTRNLVRPVALARRKADVIVGNPPWLNYNQTIDVLRDELKRQSKDVYDIWVGGAYATQQDVAGLFFARCVDLYLAEGGVIGMVMPHSALTAGQHKKWRSGRWQQRVRTGKRSSRIDRVRVDFSFKLPWDLEPLEPNDFFPIPGSVAFARRQGADPTEPGQTAAAPSRPLAGEVERWEGRPGENVTRTVVPISAEGGAGSPYRSIASNGATLYPRRFFMIEEIENPARIRAAGTVMVSPRHSKHDKSPWRDLDLTPISRRTIEIEHVFDVFLGESVAPYATLAPVQAVLPLTRDADGLAESDHEDAIGGIRRDALTQRMRERWRTVSDLWDSNKSPGTTRGLLRNMDYLHKLSKQVVWRHAAPDGAVRLVYTKSGRPTAARIRNRNAIVENTLYWMPCDSEEETAYLLAIINSEALRQAAEPFMSKGLWGARDLHKHLWSLPIPRFDRADPLHIDVAAAGESAAAGAAERLEDQNELASAAARKLIRQWLADSDEGREVERVVSELLAVG
ncbi:MAG: N-6 DNA methylase [Chloroflexi bacterium]|nr:N-6 DNA methylase [Chloroflexota bacterium]